MGDSFKNDKDVLGFEENVMVDGYEVRHQGIRQYMLTMSVD